ncbi:hypothetical protein BDA96_03G324500 [Sorghum bicolor]|uniref:Uncharacterized protein n=1 Tax=Sorghum bicolor TaxID=4558 RepID=A0A921RFL6_SORBI|nr:hypothetical protein BDA96_03G324500 [Sorghum bicolor]
MLCYVECVVQYVSWLVNVHLFFFRSTGGVFTPMNVHLLGAPKVVDRRRR